MSLSQADYNWHILVTGFEILLYAWYVMQCGKPHIYTNTYQTRWYPYIVDIYRIKAVWFDQDFKPRLDTNLDK